MNALAGSGQPFTGVCKGQAQAGRAFPSRFLKLRDAAGFGVNLSCDLESRGPRGPQTQATVTIS